VACGKKGKAKGTVTTRFTVRPDGTTQNVVIKQGIGDAAIEACLVAAFKGLSFPAAGAETKISYPVSFN
jgi:TonB family protein